MSRTIYQQLKYKLHKTGVLHFNYREFVTDLQWRELEDEWLLNRRVYSPDDAFLKRKLRQTDIEEMKDFPHFGQKNRT